MLPKKGNHFPTGTAGRKSKIGYAEAVAAALHAELGDSHQAIKTVMRWTGANERTVKNWFAGVMGPRESTCSISYGTPTRYWKACFMKPRWARDLRDQCEACGVAFFMKQMTKKADIPEDLLVRQFPELRGKKSAQGWGTHKGQ